MPPSNNESRRIEELFAQFHAARELDPSLEWEAWIGEHAEDEPQLRLFQEAQKQMEKNLGRTPAGSETRDLTSSLEGGYEILEELGSGAYGRVFRALDRRLQREVALKVLDDEVVSQPGMRRRFLDEARVLAKLDHPNIVRVHSVETREGEIQICLELLEGRTLQQVVDTEGPLSGAEAARIGLDLCRALAAIHAQGIVHLDVKPGNVVRAAGGRIVLLDFGFARGAVGNSGELKGPLGGTPRFMSPEHFEARPDIGPRADLYSVGVLLYWLVAGRYPFDGDDFQSLQSAVLAGHAIPLLDARPDTPGAFAAIVERAMARKEADRFASAGELEAMLRSFLADDPSSEAPGPARGRARRVAPALFALAVLVVAMLYFTGGGDSPPEITAQFYELRDGDTHPLSNGSQVSLQSRVFLEVEAAEPVYLYVFNQDERGHAYRLAPSELGSALSAGKTRLPSGDGYWRVDTSGGAEHLFVLSSRKPIPVGEALAAAISPPARGGVALAELTRGQRASVFRGMGQVIDEQAVKVPDVPSLEKVFEESVSKGEGWDGVRYEHVTLPHSREQ